MRSVLVFAALVAAAAAAEPRVLFAVCRGGCDSCVSVAQWQPNQCMLWKNAATGRVGSVSFNCTATGAVRAFYADSTSCVGGFDVARFSIDQCVKDALSGPDRYQFHCGTPAAAADAADGGSDSSHGFYPPSGSGSHGFYPPSGSGSHGFYPPSGSGGSGSGGSVEEVKIFVGRTYEECGNATTPVGAFETNRCMLNYDDNNTHTDSLEFECRRNDTVALIAFYPNATNCTGTTERLALGRHCHWDSKDRNWKRWVCGDAGDKTAARDEAPPARRLGVPIHVNGQRL